ncbi:MSMEG_4193 family putative phosphomutase [Georgenia alba]|uniref:MSMEG_4193 family putative phosphomutase n=1 Tax=Georgenia alba TaxID=2233858 RepID=A0ABW2Q8D0_9MICO
MATVILARHGRSTANADGVLAGRSDVGLDEAGREQAGRMAERLREVPLAAVVSSPLERCRQTAAAVLQRQPGSPPAPVEVDLTEQDYGTWQGRPLAELAKEDLWARVQREPSQVTFPDGESFPAMQARTVAAIRRHDAAVEAEHGERATWLAVTHGDVIKAILADAFGMPLDALQRIHVGPGSLSIVRYTADRPEVVATNTEAGDLSWLRPEEQPVEAQVGGGAGHEPPTS